MAGAKVMPGNYQARLSVDGKPVSTESFAIKADPRLSTTQEDFVKQYDLMTKINDKLSETHHSILEIREVKKQLTDVAGKLKPEQKDLADKAREIAKQLTAVEEELIQTKIKSGQDALNFPIKLNNKLASLGASVGSSDDAPTAQAYVVYNDLSARIDAQLAKLEKIKSMILRNLINNLRRKTCPLLLQKSRK